jgi:hypothetical protein
MKQSLRLGQEEEHSLRDVGKKQAMLLPLSLIET